MNRLVLPAGLAALALWAVLASPRTVTATAPELARPSPIESLRPDLIVSIGPELRTASTPAEAAAITGDLNVRFARRDPTDRLWLAATTASGEARVHGPVAADDVALADLPVGEIALELRTRRGKVLARSWATVRAGDDTRVELAWPDALEGPRFGTLAGDLVVSPMLAEAGLFERTTLELVPMLDTEPQARSGVETRRVNLPRLQLVSTGLLAWEFDAVPVGTYVLKLVPLGFVRAVEVRGDAPSEYLHLDCRDLGRTLLSFVDESGATVWPARVSARPVADDRQPLAIDLARRPEWNAFDLVGVPGTFRLNIQDPVFGARTFAHELGPGWDEARIVLEPVWTARVILLGRAANGAEWLDRDEVTVAALEGGRVVTSVMGRSLTGDETSYLDLQVSRPGRYRCRREVAGGVSELLLDVRERHTEASWDLDGADGDH